MDYNFQYPQGVHGAEPGYYGDQDILNIRECMAEEIGSVIGYLQCAEETYEHRVEKVFRRIANEELSHFASLLQLLTGLDSGQATEMKKQELAILTAANDGVCPYYSHKSRRKNSHNEYKRDFMPNDPVWDVLRNAIRDELYSMNAYQRQIAATTNQVVQGVYIRLLNQEKEHFVAFTKLFYEVYGLLREGLVLTE